MSWIRGLVSAVTALGLALAVVGAAAAWSSHVEQGTATAVAWAVLTTSSVASVGVGAALVATTPRHTLGWALLLVGCGVQAMLTLAAIQTAGWPTIPRPAAQAAAALVGAASLGLYAAMPVLSDPSGGGWWRWQPAASLAAATGMQWEVHRADQLGGDWLPGDSAVSEGPAALAFVVCVLLGWAYAVWRALRGPHGGRARHVLVLAAVVLIALLPLVGDSTLAVLSRGLAQWVTPLVVGASFATALSSRVEHRLRAGLALALTGAAVALGCVTALASATGPDALPASIGIVVALLVGLAAAPLRRALDAVLEQLHEPVSPQEQVARLAEASQTLSRVDLDDLADAVLRVAVETAGATGGELHTLDGTVLARLAEATPVTPAPPQTTHSLDVGGIPAGSLRLNGVPPHISPTRTRLLEALLPQLGLALRATELGRELRDQRDATVRGRDLERDRLRRDLHDSLGPSLSGMILGLQAVEGQLSRGDLSAVEDLLPRLRTEAVVAVEEVHHLLQDLGPVGLGDGQLADALRRRGATLGHRVEVDVSVGELPPLTKEAEYAVYRVAGEALTNAIRHGDPATVRILCRPLADGVELVVEDDGHGFIPDVDHAGIGMRSMRERARAVGGSLDVDSDTAGTTVTLRIPAPVGAS